LDSVVEDISLIWSQTRYRWKWWEGRKEKTYHEDFTEDHVNHLFCRHHGKENTKNSNKSDKVAKRSKVTKVTKTVKVTKLPKQSKSNKSQKKGKCSQNNSSKHWQKTSQVCEKIKFILQKTKLHFLVNVLALVDLYIIIRLIMLTSISDMNRSMKEYVKKWLYIF
jgi:Mg-chelatase subunit ChlI